MPQYGILVYSPAPADPMELSAEHLELLESYPDRAKDVGGKVLGGSYFAGQRGFAFEPSTAAVSIQGDTVRSGPLTNTDLVPAAFYVMQAPSQEVAVQAAKLHPASAGGGIEVRALLAPPAK